MADLASTRRGFFARLAALFGACWFKPVSTPPLITEDMRKAICAANVNLFNPVTRLDVLYGVANLRPSFAVRVTDEYDDQGQFIEG